MIIFRISTKHSARTHTRTHIPKQNVEPQESRQSRNAWGNCLGSTATHSRVQPLQLSGCCPLQTMNLGMFVVCCGRTPLLPTHNKHSLGFVWTGGKHRKGQSLVGSHLNPENRCTGHPIIISAVRFLWQEIQSKQSIRFPQDCSFFPLLACCSLLFATLELWFNLDTF